MNDIFQEFFDRIQKGHLVSAIQLFLTTPEVRYEQFDGQLGQEGLFSLLVNYVDAAVFGTYKDALHANIYLLNEVSKAGGGFVNVEKIFNRLLLDKELLEASLNEGSLFQLPRNFDLPASLLDNAGNYQACLKEQMQLTIGWQQFQTSKPSCAFHYGESLDSLSCPWYPLRYPLDLKSIRYDLANSIPLIFLEPVAGGYVDLLTALKNIPAIFLFESSQMLFQMLQFPEVVTSLSERHHLIYILDLYPNAQFFLQPNEGLKGRDFQVIAPLPTSRLPDFLPLLQEALFACLQQSYTELERDSEVGDWLYQVAKRYLLRGQIERLGPSRAAALQEKLNNQKWQDPHKGLPKEIRSLGPLPEDYMQLKLQRLAEIPAAIERKPNVVHIVPQIVDGGHAPSRLLEMLIRYHDHERYDLIVIVSERLCFHPSEYPYNFLVSDPSPQRAPERYRLFQDWGVLIFTMPTDRSYEQIAAQMAIQLQQMADIAVFHGPDSINCMCAQQLAIPTRILFEHGTQPAYPGFDVVITSMESALEIYSELYQSLEVQAYALPFSIDLRTSWEAQPYSRKQLGLPEKSLIMTTISNHLHSRLGDGMLMAIVEILRRVPEAFYAPMGAIQKKSEEKLIDFFHQQGVGERVHFFGAVKVPSQVARSMDLYLNEFPFGGCLGMLDGMAAGCPVVTMYDKNGAPQARYGGDYFGLERSVSSGDPRDYIDLACRLLTDAPLRQAWSEIAKLQYARHADPKKYVKAFEEIIFAHSNRRKA